MKNKKLFNRIISILLVASLVQVSCFATVKADVVEEITVDINEELITEEALETGVSENASEEAVNDGLIADETVDQESIIDKEVPEAISNDDLVGDETSVEESTKDEATKEEVSRDNTDFYKDIDDEFIIGDELTVEEDIEFDSILDYGENGVALFANDGDTMPEKYIPDLTALPDLRHQQETGTCWAHASVLLAEANMLKKGYVDRSVDFSEIALAYFATHTVVDPLGGTKGDKNEDGYSSNGNKHDWLKNGGNIIYSSVLFANWVGATDDSGEVAFSNRNKVHDENELDSKYAYSLDKAHLTGYRIFDISVCTTTAKSSYRSDAYIEANRNAAKRMIMENGAIGASFLSYSSSSSYYNAEHNSYYYPNASVTSHAISIVGWDDTFSKDNFNTITKGEYPAPKGDGAWLVRNTYYVSGELEQYWGYFWLSYYDRSLRNSRSFIFEKNDNYDNNYQYDGAVNSFTTSSDDEIYGANVFTASACEYGEMVNAISFTTASTNLEAEVRIYLNPSDGNPMSGQEIVEARNTINTDLAGYYTVPLSRSVLIKKGDSFAAVVILKKQGSTVSIYCESPSNGYVKSTTSANPNESFISDDGNTWDDMAIEDGVNVRIKAFTTNNDYFTLKYDANGGSGSIADQICPLGFEATLKENNYSRDNYAFVGWNTKSDGSGTKYQPNDNVLFDAIAKESKVLYAEWRLAYGWVQDAKGYKFLEADEVYAKNKWKDIDGKSYYFDGSGYRVTGWLNDSGKWYYFDKEGVKQTGFITDNNRKYYLGSDGSAQNGFTTVNGVDYYLGEKGEVQTDWILIGDKWFFFDEEGVKQTGFITVNNKKYYLASDGSMQTGWTKVDGKWYLLDNNGHVLTGWNNSSNKWYYLNDNGEMQTGWVNANGVWYYLNAKGEMQTGWIFANGKWYYLKASGAMATGWVLYNNKWYYLKSNGEMTTGWVLVNNKWYFLSDSGVMCTGWLQRGNTWYYLKDNGAMATGWLKFNKDWYYLYDNGSMARGWILVNGKYYYCYENGKMAHDAWIGKYRVNSNGEWVSTGK